MAFETMFPQLCVVILSLLVCNGLAQPLKAGGSNTFPSCNTTAFTTTKPRCFFRNDKWSPVNRPTCSVSRHQVSRLGPETRPWTPNDYAWDDPPVHKCIIGLRGTGTDADFFSPLDIVATADSIFETCDGNPILGYGGWSNLLKNGETVEDWRVVVYGPRVSGQSNDVDEEICLEVEQYSNGGIVQES